MCMCGSAQFSPSLVGSKTNREGVEESQRARDKEENYA